MGERSVVIIGARGGIGAALANALEQDPNYARVIRLHRESAHPLDILDEASIAAAADSLSGTYPPISLVIVATGLLHSARKGPEKSLRELDPDWMMENFRINAVGPALVAKYFLPIMAKQGPICFAALSARVGSISDNRLGGWHSYRSSKSALNMLIRNIAIEWQRKNPQSVVVGLHPGTVETALSAPFKGNPAHERFTPARAAGDMLNVLHGLKPEQSGQIFAYDGSLVAP
ncbi:SDR family NAD(P)-dependent oxidoreductase [Sphingorhabdus sp. EL138]|uniref:SDR family NAD(P)-dependent oxidoreductase n=1 Tax=Sphingorhabdus sp. EL138 TaxID=2073156 RepID=UPI0025FBE479|nr:SDR family NAD(P)-dependent oxidoreductase [Sphingorhabdus sp. EL138]